MMNINGSPVEPLDPSRMDYNAVGFPLSPALRGGFILIALGGVIASFFVTLPKPLAFFLFAPVVVAVVSGWLFAIVRSAVHAALRMDAHDSYLDEVVEESHADARAGYLSPERAAQIAAQTA